jgi:hypothetical protein
LLYTHFGGNGRQFTKALSWKLFLGGVFLIGIGALILVAPEIVAIPLAILLFLLGILSLTWSWRMFWASRAVSSGQPSATSQEGDVEDATFREIR